jgi:hypothetical protein
MPKQYPRELRERVVRLVAEHLSMVRLRSPVVAS